MLKYLKNLQVQHLDVQRFKLTEHKKHQCFDEIDTDRLLVGMYILSHFQLFDNKQLFPSLNSRLTRVGQAMNTDEKS